MAGMTHSDNPETPSTADELVKILQDYAISYREWMNLETDTKPKLIESKQALERLLAREVAQAEKQAMLRQRAYDQKLIDAARRGEDG